MRPSRALGAALTLTLALAAGCSGGGSTTRSTGEVTASGPASAQTATVDGGRQATLRVTFDKPGTYRFTCTFHSGMNGQVVVTEKRP